MQYQGTDCKGYHVKVSYCTLVSAKQCYRQISYKLSQVPGKESYHRLTHTKIVSQKKKKIASQSPTAMANCLWALGLKTGLH